MRFFLPAVVGFQISVCSLIAPVSAVGQQPVSPLERELTSVSAEKLDDEAARFSDAKRGAVLFYQPQMACQQCYSIDVSNFACKGIAVRLDPGSGCTSRGQPWMIFDHDTLRVAAAWTGEGFIDWHGIHMNGRHNIHPRIKGDVHFVTRIP